MKEIPSVVESVLHQNYEINEVKIIRNSFFRQWINSIRNNPNIEVFIINEGKTINTKFKDGKYVVDFMDELLGEKEDFQDWQKEVIYEHILPNFKNGSINKKLTRTYYEDGNQRKVNRFETHSYGNPKAENYIHAEVEFYEEDGLKMYKYNPDSSNPIIVSIMDTEEQIGKSMEDDNGDIFEKLKEPYAKNIVPIAISNKDKDIREYQSRIQEVKNEFDINDFVITEISKTKLERNGFLQEWDYLSFILKPKKGGSPIKIILKDIFNQ